MTTPPEHARFAATLERTQWMPRDQLVRYRDALVRRLVAFAYASSPFYRERLKPLVRNGDVDLTAWSDIPPLRRSDLAANLGQLNPVEVPAEVGAVSTWRTSGSTGLSLEFRSCALAEIASECMVHRLYRWHGFDLSATLASVRFYGQKPRTYPDGMTETRWSMLGPQAPHHSLDLRHPLDEIIEWLVRKRPRYLLTFPSVAYELATHPGASEIAALRLSGIVAISELATEHTREVVRRGLGTEMAQVYAAGEVGCIGLQAPADDRVLICDEAVLVELVDEDGRPVGPGETGRVLLTSLYNYATPFLRYDIGDYATWSEGPCPSGRTLSSLRRIEGRARNGLVAKGGRLIWPNQIPVGDLSAAAAASHIQIVQNGSDEIELLYVSEPGAPEPDRAAIDAMFANMLGIDVGVMVRAVDRIARSGGGKRELVISAVAPPDHAIRD